MTFTSSVSTMPKYSKAPLMRSTVVATNSTATLRKTAVRKAIPTVVSDSSKVTTTLGKFSNYIIGATFMAVMGLGAATSQSPMIVKTKVADSREKAIIKGKSPNNVDDAQKFSEENLTTFSKELQESFNFNTAQWAWALKVERKTLYNWMKNPGTKVHTKAAERLNDLGKFISEVVPEHRKFLPKFIFGKFSDNRFSDLLVAQKIDADALINAYEDLYIAFDGMYKRQKLR